MWQKLTTIVAVLTTIVVAPLTLLFLNFWFQDHRTFEYLLIGLAVLVPNVSWFFIGKKESARPVVYAVGSLVLLSAAVTAFLVFGFFLAIAHMTATGHA